MNKLISCCRLFNKSFSFLGAARKRYVLGVAMGSLELALLFATPYIYQILIDIVTGERDGNIMTTLVAMLMLFVLFVPLVVVGKYWQATATATGTANLRKAMFRHIAELPYETITRYKTGDYITRLTDDVNRTTNIFNSFSIVNLIRFAVVFSVTLTLLLINDWRIAVAGILYGAVNLVLSLRLNPYAKFLERDAKLEVVNSTSFLVEALRGLPIIRVFFLQSTISERYRRSCEVIREKRIKYRTVIGITYGVVDFFAQSAQAVGFIIGVLLAGNNMSPGRAVFNATLMGMMGDAVYRLSTFLLLIQPNIIAMGRTFELLDLPTEDLATGNEKLSQNHQNAVEFRNVSFSYPEGEMALDSLNLTLKSGENLAIVGGSGGGKSTIIKLMEGFYTPDSGQILYYGKPESAMSKADIRRIFAYVPQECALFDGSIGANIEMGRSGATRAEVENAAQIANLHDFIQSLPQQYDTPVGEGGGRLSGGQKQRVAIARAILKDAPVLLLDEATAALDSRAEKDIQQCLDSISKTMTTVTVAHRLSTVRGADRIIVLENGKIVEEGTFEALLHKNGRFRELYDNQG
jgi:ABC-type multidrug transport system fused ATPase/permease subunit